jgi:hypothetical protein
VGFAAVVHSCTDPGITHQLLGAFKPRNIANGSQHRHRDDKTHTGQLHDLQSLFAPQSTRALALELFIHRFLELLDLLQQSQFLTDLHLLQCRNVFLLIPPGLIQQPFLR